MSNKALVRLLWAMIAGCVIALAGIAVAIPAKASDTFALFSGDEQTGAITQAAIRDVLSPSIAPDDDTRQTLDARVTDFYQARDFKPVWTGNEDSQSNADLVRDTLGRAEEQGLQASDYAKALSLWSGPPEPGEDAAAFDIALTRALFRYALDVRLGRVNPADVYKDVNLPPQDFDIGAAFAKALRHGTVGDFLDDLPPHHPGYRGLVKALAFYRDIADRGGWPKVPAGISLERNDPRQAVLAARLSFGDSALASAAHPTPADLRIAVLRFQRRMGLVDNGKLDTDTRAALNVSAGYRAKQIAANMERWRWVSRGFERDYIYVNVPDESLDFVHNRTSLLHSRVIIGMKTSPTPIMRTIVQAAVVNPPWDIPDDIAARKLLPHLKQDARYLASRDMVLADGPSDDPHGTKVDWRHVKENDIPYQIQQNPGADNALGTLMLDSPNDFGVYMHDTPHKELFRAASRDKSNGCVRVQEIFALASLALKEDPEDNDDLQQMIDAGKTQRLPLPAPLPVYMLYWTAIADVDGPTQFRPDRYDRDPPLIARLTARPQPRPRKKAPVLLSGAT
jgi:murein L,D-transpeptidase YcbB/YkuD